MVTKEQRKRWNATAYKKRRNNPEEWKKYLSKERKRYAEKGRKKYPNICIVCDKKFYSVRKDRKYCSRKCISTGKHNGRWSGGKHKNNKGYIMVYSPHHPNKVAGNYVLEHRLVMEKHIGRFLRNEEVVHHKNNIKDDNRIENLQLFATTSDHSKFHTKKGTKGIVPIEDIS